MIFKNTRQVFLCVLVSIMMSYGCHKDSDPPAPQPALPSETQTGANTFGCSLDGSSFLPDGSKNPSLSLVSFPARVNYDFEIDAYSKKGTMRILQHGVKSTGTYTFTSFDIRNSAIIGLVEGTYYSQDGTLIITKLDTVNKIISGTFSFTALSASGQKTVKVTSGRFDLKK